MSDPKAELLDKILYSLVEYDLPLDEVRNKLTMALHQYTISEAETHLVIYTGKNDQIVKRFLLAKAVAGSTKKTLEYYGSQLTKFLDEAGNDFDQITPEYVQFVLAEKLARGLSRYTVDTLRRVLSSFYTWANREELIKNNPMLRIEKIKLRGEKKYAFTDIEVERLRANCISAKERCLFEVMLSTGCRISEIINIKIDDLKEDKLTVLGKGDKYRTVYLNAKAQLAIELYLKERKDKNPYLYPHTKPFAEAPEKYKSMGLLAWSHSPYAVNPDGHMASSSVESLCRALGKRAKVENVHPHRFRRTCATLALRKGMPIELVSKMLGHEQIGTTQIYLDITEQELENAHRKYVV